MVIAVAKNPLGQHEPGLIPVAQYVRMSTEHQRYSTENQGLAIQEYADSHGMQIVKTYADAGKSGLNIRGRAGLQSVECHPELTP